MPEQACSLADLRLLGVLHFGCCAARLANQASARTLALLAGL
ncbi:hypothetical protein [Metapseudomonas otitidis]|nr:hypothetical protein [Pseudomonas otitidis]